jgi:hypothetical protein
MGNWPARQSLEKLIHYSGLHRPLAIERNADAGSPPPPLPARA